VVGTVALTETLLAFSAVSDANYVRSGHAVQPTFLGVPLVSWGARAVEVAWDGQPPAGLGTLVDHCFLYLGQGGGVVLLYDHDTGRTVRISSSAVVLSIQPLGQLGTGLSVLARTPRRRLVEGASLFVDNYTDVGRLHEWGRTLPIAPSISQQVYSTRLRRHREAASTTIDVIPIRPSDSHPIKRTSDSRSPHHP
jgi:hypothetical protein